MAWCCRCWVAGYSGPRASGAGDDLLHFLAPRGGEPWEAWVAEPPRWEWEPTLENAGPEHVRGSVPARGSHEESHEI
jgi:hypothetical protein